MGRREARVMVDAQGSWMRVVAVFMALALAASACGGGDSAESAADADDASAENAPAEEVSELEAAGDQANETGEIPQLAEQDPADDDRDVALTRPGFIDTDPDSDFCVAARNIEVEVIDTDDPFGGAGIFESLDSAIGEIQPLAPAELEGDIVVIRDFAAELIPLLDAENIFSLETAGEIASLNSSAVDEAGERLDVYLTEICGVEEGFGIPAGAVDSPSVDTNETLDETISLDGAGTVTGMMDVGTFDAYELEVFEGSTLTITMQPGPDPLLDPILRVIDPKGAVVENDDAPDGAGLEGFDSQVIIDPTVGGLYSIEARSFFGLGSGEFTLTVEIG